VTEELEVAAVVEHVEAGLGVARSEQVRPEPCATSDHLPELVAYPGRAIGVTSTYLLLDAGFEYHAGVALAWRPVNKAPQVGLLQIPGITGGPDDPRSGDTILRAQTSTANESMAQDFIADTGLATSVTCFAWVKAPSGSPDFRGNLTLWDLEG
jgi:hypothetical protein